MASPCRSRRPWWAGAPSACPERRARRRPDQVVFARDDWLVFGSETDGLPDAVLEEFEEDCRLRLPMRPGNRSLNLSNAVAVTVFEAWRQFGYEGMAP